jgi:hypothetical protein
MSHALPPPFPPASAQVSPQPPPAPPPRPTAASDATLRDPVDPLGAACRDSACAVRETREASRKIGSGRFAPISRVKAGA